MYEIRKIANKKTKSKILQWGVKQSIGRTPLYALHIKLMDSLEVRRVHRHVNHTLTLQAVIWGVNPTVRAQQPRCPLARTSILNSSANQ